MKFPCQSVDESFLDNAPVQFVNETELEASAATVFAIFEDAQAWPRWFDDIVKVEWTSPRPFGVGTTRTVTLKTLTVYERFFIWETGRRFAFHFDAMSLPLASRFCEDYRLEPLSEQRCRFHYTVAFEPRLLLRLGGGVARRSFATMFENATQNLADYVRTSN